MLSIADYEIHPHHKEQWGKYHMVTTLDVWDGKHAAADKVFKYLNRPLPDGTKPDDQVDVTAAIPKLMTLPELAELTNISLEEAQERLFDSYFGDDEAYGDDPDNPLYYMEQVEHWLTEPRMTINALAEHMEMDRRTVKRHLDAALARDYICKPRIEKQGGREYRLFWLCDAMEICGKADKPAFSERHFNL